MSDASVDNRAPLRGLGVQRTRRTDLANIADPLAERLLRLLASRFASQLSLSYRSRQRSCVNLDAGGRWKAKPVVGAFVHTLWTSVWKYERLQSPACLRGRAKAQTTADLCFAYPHRGPDARRLPEDCGVTSERTF
jgi:hypothetical protein